MSKFRPHLLLAGLLLVTGGCGSKSQGFNEVVEGTVKLDNVPLAGVVVEFVPDAWEGKQPPLSSAITDEKGYYRLKCENQNPGAVLGKHLVVVRRGREGAPNPDGPPMPPLPSGPPVPSVYGTARYTPLVIEVTADKTTYDLQLSSRAEAR